MYEDLLTDKNIKKQLPGILRFLIQLFQIILYILTLLSGLFLKNLYKYM